MAAQSPGPRRWKWARHPDGEVLRAIGLASDGTLINPNGYPEDRVRDTITAATERTRARRQKSAAKAAVTRERRRGLKVDAIARRIIDGQEIGPRQKCAECGRRLTDAESVQRGVGTECWSRLLATIEQLAAEKMGAR